MAEKLTNSYSRLNESSLSRASKSSMRQSNSFLQGSFDQKPNSMTSSDGSQGDDDGYKKTKVKLVPTYNVVSLVMLGFGNTIGSGVFTLTGIASKSAGSAVFLAFILAGLVALSTAMVFAEFAGRIPKSGSAYIYTYTTVGELPAWIVGWNQCLRYGGVGATMSRGWSSYAVSLLVVLGLSPPEWLDNFIIGGWLPTSPLAAVFIMCCTWITTRGSESAGNFNNVVTSIKLCILLFIVVVALCNFEQKNFTPFLNEEKGIEGLVEASTIVFFGYLGFDFITTMSAEAINPKETVPKAVNFSVFGSMMIYAAVAFSVNGVGNLAAQSSGDGETALADIFTKRGMPYMAFVIYFCALFGISAAVMTCLMSQARILYAYAKDGLFFEVFKELDPVTKVPVKGAWIGMIPVVMAAFVFNLQTAAKICTLANLMTYSFIDAQVIALRLSEAPQQHEGGQQHTGLIFNRKLIKYSPWTYLILAFVSSVAYANKYTEFNSVIQIILACNFIILQILVNQVEKYNKRINTKTSDEFNEFDNDQKEEEVKDKDLFKCPLVPLIPCSGIYVNFMLVTIGVGINEWKLFGAFEFLGFLFYMFYGYRNSSLPEKLEKHSSRKQSQDNSLLSVGQKSIVGSVDVGRRALNEDEIGKKWVISSAEPVIE